MADVLYTFEVGPLAFHSHLRLQERLRSNQTMLHAELGRTVRTNPLNCELGKCQQYQSYVSNLL